MTAPESHPSAADRRSVPLLVAAAALVVVVVAAVLVFGVARPPALPALADRPEPAPGGSVAWTAWEDGDTCVRVARPDGSVDTPYCDAGSADVVGWTHEGIVLRVWRDGQQLVVVDPDDGGVVDRRRPDGPVAGELPEGVRAERRDGLLAVDLERDGTTVWVVDAPEPYTVRSGAVSPDGRWVAMVDSAGRLLVAPADGDDPPRVWAEDVRGWAPPVWEGVGHVE